MAHKMILLVLLGLFLFIHPSPISAADCDPTVDTCLAGKSCLPDKPGSNNYTWQDDPFCESFGRISAPGPLKDLIKNNPTGAGAISQFLNNLITLIYAIGGIVLVFMLVWGAFEWTASGGDKEKIESARRRILNAIIGMILFAVAFAVINILGQFTGFKFFV